MYDGISLSSCVVEDKTTTFTYTAGTLAGGLIEEYKLTKNKTLLQIAHNISSTVLIFLTDRYGSFIISIKKNSVLITFHLLVESLQSSVILMMLAA